MSFSIENAANGGGYRIVGDKGNLVGLISEANSRGPDTFRVELMMKIDCHVHGKKEAFSFVRGAEAAMRAFKVIPSEK